MATKQDSEDLVRLGHLREATQTPTEFTDDSTWHDTIARVGDKADNAFQTLDSASDAHVLDQSENTKVKTTWVDRLTAVVELIDWLATGANARLLNLRPGAPQPKPEEMQDRKTIVQKLRAANSTVLLKSRPTAAINMINKLAEEVDAAPAEWFSAQDKADLKDHAAQCQVAWQGVVAESLDDDKWMAELQSARVLANQTLVGGRSILSGVLLLNNSPLTVDDVILKLSYKKASVAAEVGSTEQPAGSGQSDQPPAPPADSDVPVA